jgi:hypothetical protein
MRETAELLKGWDSFYVMIGSSAAALIGLQFVVIALVADIEHRATTRAIDAFSTPTVVHFGTVLLVSAVLSAPWSRIEGVGWTLGIVGAAGLGYTMVVVWRARSQTEYRMVMEDWLFHVILPFVAYGVLLIAGASLARAARLSLFVVAATA